MEPKGERKQREELETTSKLLEKNFSTEENQFHYNKCKRGLEEIYDNTAEGYASGVSGMKKVQNPHFS